MKPKTQPRDAFELFQAHFDQLLDPDHELVQLANQIDWPSLDAAFGDCYRPDIGAPAKAIRLMVGLHYLKYTFNESDDAGGSLGGESILAVLLRLHTHAARLPDPPDLHDEVAESRRRRKAGRTTDGNDPSCGA